MTNNRLLKGLIENFEHRSRVSGESVGERWVDINVTEAEKTIMLESLKIRELVAKEKEWYTKRLDQWRLQLDSCDAENPETWYGYDSYYDKVDYIKRRIEELEGSQSYALLNRFEGVVQTV